MRRVVLDIETIPIELKLPSEAEASVAEDGGKKAALDALTGKIVCIGLIFTKGEYEADHAVAILSRNEKNLLSSFWSVLAERKSSSFIAHNGLGFDLPFLWKRSVVNGIKPTVNMDLRRYRSDFMYDTMAVWANWEPRNYVSLDALARVLNIGEKSGSGGQVLDLWKSEKYSEIGNYCLQDCWLTFGCYCRMNFQSPPARESTKTEIKMIE